MDMIYLFLHYGHLLLLLYLLEHSAGPVWNPCQPWDRSGFIGCINSIDYGTYSSQSDNSFDFVYGVAYAYDDNTYGEIRYSFIDGIDSCTNDMNRRRLSDVSLGCNSNRFRGQNTISLKCPNNDEYITGLRYMTLSESNIQAEIIQTQIAGFEVICSNLDYIGTPNIYYNSDTQFQMLPYDLENSDSYLAQFKKFSPWFICPPGYEISINMQIYTDCYKQDSASFFIDWFKQDSAKCAMKYDWYGYTTDQNVNLKCVEIYEHSEKTIEDAMCLTWDDVNYSFYKYSGDDSYYSDDWKIWYHIAYSTRYNTNIWMLGNVASDTRNNGERECWGPADPKDCWWLNADGGHESSANGISTQYGPC